MAPAAPGHLPSDRLASLPASQPQAPRQSDWLAVPSPPCSGMTAKISWSDEAEQLLRDVPFFVRPAVRRRIEELAGAAGRAAVDGDFYRQARESFGRKRTGDDVKG